MLELTPSPPLLVLAMGLVLRLASSAGVVLVRAVLLAGDSVTLGIAAPELPPRPVCVEIERLGSNGGSETLTMTGLRDLEWLGCD